EHHVTSVRRFPASGTLQERDILRLAAGVESLSPHPLASSVVNYYTGCAASYVESPSTLPAVENFRTVGDNLGVAGTVEGKEVMIGGPAMLRYLGLGLEKITEGSASVLFVVIDGKVALSLELEDRIRPGAQEALKSLKKPTMMLTGDRPSVARDVAAEIGIDDYKADLRPGDKLDFIRDYQASDPKTLPLTHARMGSSIQHPVMMVGDGLNDGPALALAAVGVSFASPCRAVSEKAADIVITDPNRGLFLLSHLIVLGSRVRNIIRENLALALCTKAIVVAVGAAGYIPLWASVLSDGLCLLLVMVNGARPLDWKPSNAAVMDKFVNEATQVRSSAVPVPVKEPSSTKCKSSCCQKGAGNTCCGSKSDKACGGASESLPNRGLAPPTNEVRSCRASKCCSVPNVEGRQQQASKCCDDAQEAAAVGSASCRSKQCCKAGPN
ncbi:Copper-transporting ATPase, partial [Perkinsus chesapeaki]